MGKIVKRGTDILATVELEKKSATADEIASQAAHNSEVPNYKPDGCGAILLFHTPDHKIHGLGGLRDNPALKDHRTSKGEPFQHKSIPQLVDGYLIPHSL